MPNPSQDTTQDTDDFDAAFAEATAAATPAPAPAPAPAADEPVDEDDAAPAPAPAPAADKPAEEPKPEDEPPKSEADELRERLTKALHAERSASNRISAFARENNQLRQQVNELTKQVRELKAKASTPAPAPAPTADVLTEAPDLEAAVKRRVDEATAGLQSTVEALQERLAAVGQPAEPAAAPQPSAAGEQEQVVRDTLARLDREFTGWRAELNTPEFADWLKAQPHRVQDAYENAVTFEDSAFVLRLFRADKGATTAPAPAPAPTPAPAPGKDRLRQAAGIAPRGAAPPPPSKRDDFEGSFDEFARQRQKAKS